MDKETCFKIILDCAFQVHTALGPGLLESSYEECMFYEIRKAGLWVQKQQALPLIYEEVKLEVGYRADLFVENCVIVEVKSVEVMNAIFLAQILTYLKLSGCNLGLLVNFNVRHLKDGIKRVVI
jgi:GxxExxY protein